jgi:hypothetical protein
VLVINKKLTILSLLSGPDALEQDIPVFRKDKKTGFFTRGVILNLAI